MENDSIEKVRRSIESLADQCQQAWEESRKIIFPQNYKNVENVVVCGMGGSGLPTHFITSVFQTKVPLILVNDYNLPNWVSEKTLVLLSSYSGNTEETLSCGQQAKEKNCLITGITSGGKLAEWMRVNGYPTYVFTPRHNPSGLPRLGLGYGIFGQLGILTKVSLVEESENGLEQIIREAIKRIRSSFQSIEERAKLLLAELKGHGVIIFGANHLVGNAHIFANQLNETSKTFSAWFSLPEADHHLMEGLKYPAENLVGIFLLSSLYSDTMKKRFALTAEVVRKNNFSTYEYKSEVGSLLEEALEVLVATSIASFELALSYKEDPSKIPWVDWFKVQLAK